MSDEQRQPQRVRLNIIIDPRGRPHRPCCTHRRQEGAPQNSEGKERLLYAAAFINRTLCSQQQLHVPVGIPHGNTVAVGSTAYDLDTADVDAFSGTPVYS